MSLIIDKIKKTINQFVIIYKKIYVERMDYTENLILIGSPKRS